MDDLYVCGPPEVVFHAVEVFWAEVLEAPAGKEQDGGVFLGRTAGWNTPGPSCVDPASDIQICSIVNSYFKISLAGSPAMDLLDVADSYHKCSQYLFC